MVIYILYNYPVTDSLWVYETALSQSNRNLARIYSRKSMSNATQLRDSLSALGYKQEVTRPASVSW